MDSANYFKAGVNLFILKKGFVVFWLLLLLSAIGTLFWYNDWVYRLPTPIPKDYQSVASGKLISLNNTLENEHLKPVFLHFFNPDCPCSKFNIKQFKALVLQYGSRVDFRVVVMSQKIFTEKAIQDKFDLDIPVVFDQAIAEACGVYSTPQAVLLDHQYRLFYKGNYNASRYCTDEKTNFAKKALDGVLLGKNHLKFDALALTAYGCSLPGCKN